MNYSLNASDFQQKKIWDLGGDFSGSSADGERISFTNYYMMKNGEPFYGISGEFHYSRMDASMWEDEIAKMQMCGINIVSTYVFWIHHEEEEGCFDFTGRRDIRRFLELCAKYGMYVILRIGPFDHGEVRNGGIPDWMYGKPFEVRQLNEGFLYYTKRLYEKIAQEVKGLFLKDNGPVIGVQIDNEYMHSSAPWELTTGVSNEWLFKGNEGDAYMLKLKELAAECGLVPAFYTCTGWGGASSPESMLPLWGGYAFQPWLFYSYQGEHPSTKEYVYQDLHNNEIPKSYNFEPNYQPEDKPYACCEMGGGMNCSYYYRFVLPYKSVDAMANIKIASGCNFLGYYMFQGGSNPVGKHGAFLNEGQMPKISYDFQAALGEFGQVRESYQRLKAIHYFTAAFAKQLCGMKTVLPKGASGIDPKDLETLRFSVRTDGHSGFLFLNNYQDHEKMPAKEEETVEIRLPRGTIVFPKISIAGDENCILPFHLDLQGIDLVCATAQPVTYMEINGELTYVFLRPDGMRPEFVFEKGASVNGGAAQTYRVDEAAQADTFTVSKDGVKRTIICVSRAFANRLYALDQKGFLFTDAAVMVRDQAVYIETEQARCDLYAYPKDLLSEGGFAFAALKEGWEGCPQGFGRYETTAQEKSIPIEVKEVAENRYTITLPKDMTDGVKDVRLRIEYRGDIGHAFIDGQMIHDNFCNNAPWEIGMRTFAEALKDCPLTVYITPLKEGAKVNVESAMAARIEEVESCVGEIKSVVASPVYELRIM